MESSSSSCAFEFATHGRQGIGIVQPQSGTNYPLVYPSEDVRYLLADFYMSFDQPSDYDPTATPFLPPFRIHHLSGFGCGPPTVSIGESIPDDGMSSQSLSSMSATPFNIEDYTPVPVNPHDIVIVDSLGQIVFDSTDDDITHGSRLWGERLRIVTWQHPSDVVVSLTYHTKWDHIEDCPTPREYPSYFLPEAAQLDERAVERLPKRIRKVTVVLDQFEQIGLEFVSGYNMRFNREPTLAEDGGRRSTRVVMDATPGLGLGIFPGCEPDLLVIRTINGVRPTDHGDFYMAASGCLWVRQPTTLLSENPRKTLPNTDLSPGNEPDDNLPDPGAGLTTAAVGWPVDERFAHLMVGNDCTACCDCQDYVDVANYLNSTRDNYQKLGNKVQNLRNIYHENRERWLAAALCVSNRPLRVRILPQICPFLDVAIQYCNQTNECQRDVELKVNFETTPSETSAEIVPGFSFIKGASRVPGRATGATERYNIAGTYPEFTAYFDAIWPNQSAIVRFRLNFANCGLDEELPYVVTACLTATVGGEAVKLQGDEASDEPIKVTDTQTLNCPVGPEDLAVDPLACLERENE